MLPLTTSIKTRRRISLTLIFAVVISLFCTIPVFATTGYVAEYYKSESDEELSGMTTYTVDDVSAPELEGYICYSCSKSVTYIYTKPIEAYVNGYADDTFKPDNAVSRAETSKMLYKFLTPSDNSESIPSDVLENEWYYESVSALFNSGILDGYSDGTFKPDATMTRAEFVKALVLMSGLSGTTNASFRDVASNHWALSYIQTGIITGLLNGYPDGTFKPDNPISRGEVVSLINRLYNTDISSDAIASSGSPFSDVKSTHWAYSDIMIASGAIGTNPKADVSNYYLDNNNKVVKLSDRATDSVSIPELEGWVGIKAEILNRYYYSRDDEANPVVTLNEIGITETEWEVLREINRIRIAAGIHPASTRNTLQSAARTRATEALTLLSRTRPNGLDYLSIFSQYDINYKEAGEYIDQHGKKDDVSGFMEIAKYDDINTRHDHIGVAISDSTNANYNYIYERLYVTDGDVTRINIASDTSYVVAKQGTDLEDLGVIIRVYCTECGYSYMPLLKEMCSDYDPYKIGSQSIVVSYGELTALLRITVVY